MRFSTLFKSSAPQHHKRTNKPPLFLKLSFWEETNRRSLVHRRTSALCVFEFPTRHAFLPLSPLWIWAACLYANALFGRTPSPCAARTQAESRRDSPLLPWSKQHSSRATEAERGKLVCPFLSVCVYSVTGPTCSFLFSSGNPFLIIILSFRLPRKNGLVPKSCAKTQADFRSVASLLFWVWERFVELLFSGYPCFSVGLFAGHCWTWPRHTLLN